MVVQAAAGVVDRADRRDFARADDGSGWRHDRDRDRGVLVPTVSRMDSGAARPVFLSRPARLSPDAD